jgi:hypothetical protein
MQGCGASQPAAKQLCCKTAAFYSWWERRSAAHETAAFHNVQTQLRVKLRRFTTGGNEAQRHMKLQRFTACQRSSDAAAVKLRRFTTGGNTAPDAALL